ncbi:MAG: nitronate monooxygenase [Brevundimonas sp. 32-68-21]|nr:MAG: nitronate monooxygenase [Brevundimonas sp. 32-68-21]
MFLVSGPDLVVEACNAGIIGTFPSLNQRTAEGYRDWIHEIKGRLKPGAAAFGVNHIVHPTNPRLMADMTVSVEEKVPLIITSLGAVRDVVDAVHGYGGVVFHDIANIRHARKAAEAAALMLGADFAYMGTRFINTTEAMAADAYKQMIIDSGSTDIVHTPAVSGIPANFMSKSLIENGIDPKHLPEHKLDMGDEAKAWKTVWSAGQGAGAIHDVLPTTELVGRLRQEFAQATEQFSARTANL